MASTSKAMDFAAQALGTSKEPSSHKPTASAAREWIETKQEGAPVAIDDNSVEVARRLFELENSVRGCSQP